MPQIFTKHSRRGLDGFNVNVCCKWWCYHTMLKIIHISGASEKEDKKKEEKERATQRIK